VAASFRPESSSAAAAGWLDPPLGTSPPVTQSGIRCLTVVWAVRVAVAQAGETLLADAGKPDLKVVLIRIRGSTSRPVVEGVGILPHVVEVTATVVNIGDAAADETITRFWVSGAAVDRELRVVHTPALLHGDEIEVTALWDLRDGPGAYTITATADAYAQLDEASKDNNVASVEVIVRGLRVESVE
jgi:subtilase family serine protease